MKMNLAENIWVYVAIAFVSSASFILMFHLSNQLK